MKSQAQVLLLVASALLVGCTDETAGTYGLTLQAKVIEHKDGSAGFTGPNGAFEYVPMDDIAGRPVWVGVYEPGFIAGTDLPLYSAWGTMPESMMFSHTLPMQLEEGAYDWTIVVYLGTEVTEDQMVGPVPPFPANGDVTAFTFGDQAIEGEAEPVPGILRSRIAGADLIETVENKLPRDPENPTIEDATKILFRLP